MERPYRKGLGVLRLVAVYALVGALLYFARPTVVSLLVGVSVVAAGEAVRIWAAGHLRKTAELITSGPYRYTRNPLYLGRLLIFTGICIMAHLPHGSGWIVLLAGYGVFFGYYLPRKERVEPARLRQLHGAAFERYRRSVPALFPSLRPYPGAEPRAWSAARAYGNREHWMVVGLLAAALVLCWRVGS